MPSDFLPRRRFLSTATLALTCAALPLRAYAFSSGDARALIDRLVAEINAVIASGKPEAALIRDFEGIFDRYADVPIMARYVLGVDGRSASAADRRAFTAAFKGYISRKYGRRFREFIGGRIEVQSARKIKAGYEIRSIAYLRGESPFEVTFLVSDKSGRGLFFNMFIEGVNLLLTERTEMGAILDRNNGSIAKLTSAIKKMG